MAHSRNASMDSRATGKVILEGWLLKKRRKKMQGFARRYVTVYESGLLSYSFGPGKPARDRIVLADAAISTSAGRKDIHVDSNTATFHLKCLSTEDFNQWMLVFRKFIVVDGRRSIGLLSRNDQIQQSQSTLEEMGNTIYELETALNSISTELGDLKKKTEKPSGNDNSIRKKLFKRSSSTGDNDSVKTNSSTGTTNQQKVQSAIAALKSQQINLIKALQILATADANQSLRASPLPPTIEEDETGASKRYSASRISMASSFNSEGGGSEFYDAYTDIEDSTGDDEDVHQDGEEGQENGISDSRSSLSSREDDEEPFEEVMGESGSTAPTSVPTSEVKETPKGAPRRTELPCGPVGDEGSLFSVLKKNVGKDLASVALPVSFNEPLTILQNSAQEVEYEEILDKAAESSDPIERIAYVAAFAVSGYAHTKHKSGRKNFTPLLAETFEDDRLNFIAEKVQHQPFVMAFNAKGNSKKWELYGTASGKTKFWGKSLEIIPVGVTHLKIGEDHYKWSKPSSFLRNLMMGTKYLEHIGKLTVENVTTKAKCVIDFKESGFWGASNVVAGQIYDSDGHAKNQLEGRWDEQLALKTDSSHLQVLWRMRPFPQNAPEFYGLSSYGITLNEITEDMKDKLPPTDSRLRPDVRALENGDLDTAEEGKNALEEQQRERRRKGKDAQPRWFSKEGDEWIYKGGYWEARQEGWKDVKIEALW